VDTFNACAVSDKKCVPQRADEGLYPVPPECALDTQFDLNGFTGRWYITAGLNPLFDIFDCQVRLCRVVHNCIPMLPTCLWLRHTGPATWLTEVWSERQPVGCRKLVLSLSQTGSWESGMFPIPPGLAGIAK